ncbi:MAG TPA: glycosyltransferase family 4 protein [Kofleriaceae bacterium]
MARRVAVIGGWAPSLIQFRAPLLRALVARGHTVIALAPDGTDAVRAKLDAIGVAFQPIALERAGLDPRRDLASLRALVQTLRAVQPDLVLGYTIKPVIYGTLAAKLARVPRRVAMITGLGYALTEPASRKQRAVSLVARALYRLALAQCELLFVQNPDDRADLARLGALPPSLRVELVRGSGVDLAHYAPAPIPAGPPIFLFLGRILRDKGVPELVAAARIVREARPDVRVQIAGWLDPNPESASHQDVAAWTDVEYLGDLPDVRPALAAAHAFVLPSHREGTPRSVLEAMAVGRAVITTDAPGCRETVVDGESGLLVPVNDPAALAAAMLRLANDPALLARLAAAGHARVRALYDADRVAAGMLDALDL